MRGGVFWRKVYMVVRGVFIPKTPFNAYVLHPAEQIDSAQIERNNLIQN